GRDEADAQGGGVERRRIRFGGIQEEARGIGAPAPGDTDLRRRGWAGPDRRPQRRQGGLRLPAEAREGSASRARTSGSTGGGYRPPAHPQGDELRERGPLLQQTE